MEFYEWKKTVNKKKSGMKNKKKATEIVNKITTCPKCKQPMKWIADTNICVCPTCTYVIGKDENKEEYSFTKTLNDRNIKFLRDNYDAVKEREEKDNE